MNEISFTIYGDPHAQKRHKHFKRGKFTGTYDPSSRDKAEFLLMVQKHRPQRPIEGPVRLDVAFYFSRPKAHYGTGRNANVLKHWAPEYHTSRPDQDNLMKFCMDALNGIFWKDDSYIAQGSFVKKYSESPRVEITINEL